MFNIQTFRKGRRITAPFVVPTTNLKLWLKASDIAGGNNDPVSAWTDNSPAANNLSTTIGSPTLKTSAINGYSSVEFTNDTMAAAAAVASAVSQTTTFMVLAPVTTALGFVFIQGSSAFSWESGDINGNFYIANSGGATAGTSVLATFEVRTLTSNGSTMTAYYNGTAGSAVAYSPDTGTAVFKLGSGNFSMAEILVYNTLLSTTVIDQIEAYLSAKYGITIS